MEFATERGYPSFAPCFDKSPYSTVPVYLNLLSPRYPIEAEVRYAVEIVRRCTRISENKEAEVVALLTGSGNWRPHLVGAVAVLLGVNTEATRNALWVSFDGSWVSPQLAVAAFLRDPAFETNARPRIEAGCPATIPEYCPKPGYWDELSRQPLSALVFLCRQLPTATEWLDDALEDERIRELSNDEWDHGDRIAAEWQASIQKAMKDIWWEMFVRRITLKQPIPYEKIDTV